MPVARPSSTTSSRCSADPVGRGQVGLGDDRDLGGAPDLGQLADQERVARPDLLVGREADADHVDLGPGASCTRSLSRSPSSVRGRCRPGGVDQDQLGVGPVHDAAHHGARGLRLVGGDHDLLPDQRVGQRRLAGVGTADEAGEAAPVSSALVPVITAHRSRPGRSRPRSPRRSSRPPCRRARSVRGRRRAAAAADRRASSP